MSNNTGSLFEEGVKSTQTKKKGDVDLSKLSKAESFLRFARAELSDTINWPQKSEGYNAILKTGNFGDYVKDAGKAIIETPSSIGTYQDGTPFAIIPLVARLNFEGLTGRGLYLDNDGIGFAIGKIPFEKIIGDNLKFEVQLLNYFKNNNKFYRGDETIQFKGGPIIRNGAKGYLGEYNNFEGKQGTFEMIPNKDISGFVQELYFKNLGFVQELFSKNESNIYTLSENLETNVQRERLNLKNVPLSVLQGKNEKMESTDDDSGSYLRMIMD